MNYGGYSGLFLKLGCTMGQVRFQTMNAVQNCFESRGTF